MGHHSMRKQSMSRAKSLVSGVMLAGLCSVAHASPQQVPVPPGIGIGLTLEGPAFVDTKRMTLYTIRGTCTTERRTVVRQPVSNDGDVGFSLIIDSPRSCLDKRPPLLAPADARPVGKWTLQKRADGAMQWAYDGNPLYTSIKDKAPGDINGSYPTRIGRGRDMYLAASPLSGVPAGIIATETARGLALAAHNGKVLYYRNEGKDSECSGECERLWKPFAAPAIVSDEGLSDEWSVWTRRDGSKQWARGGRPLYIYMYDSPSHGEQFWGDTFGGTWQQAIKGWQVALLKTAPGRPAAVRVQTLSGENEVQNFGLPKNVYADSGGMTLYTMHCPLEEVDCDDVGDDPRYWLSFCGGEQRCAKTWRPLPAPANARSIDGIWTVVAINPVHPWRLLEPGARGMSVWAYRGRPVFTYAHDLRPGDYNGDDHGFGTTGSGQMQARPILAYAADQVGAPVLSEIGRKQ